MMRTITKIASLRDVSTVCSAAYPGTAAISLIAACQRECPSNFATGFCRARRKMTTPKKSAAALAPNARRGSVQNAATRRTTTPTVMVARIRAAAAGKSAEPATTQRRSWFNFRPMFSAMRTGRREKVYVARTRCPCRGSRLGLKSVGDLKTTEHTANCFWKWRRWRTRHEV